MNPAYSFGETMKKCLVSFDDKSFWGNPEKMLQNIMLLSGNKEAKIAIWETLKKDQYKVGRDSNSMSVFIMESYLHYLELIGKGNRNIWKIENVDFPIIEGIIKA